MISKSLCVIQDHTDHNYIGSEQLLCAFTVIINNVKPKHAFIKAFHGMRLKFGELILRATIQGVSAFGGLEC